MRIIILIIAVVVSSLTLSAQDEKLTPCDYTPTNKKALKLIDKGRDKGNTVEERIGYLKELIVLEPEWAEAYNELAINQYKVYKVRGSNWKGCEENLRKTIELCKDLNMYAYFYLGKYAYEKENWLEAIDLLKTFTKSPENAKTNDDFDEAEGMLNDAKFNDKMKNHPVPFNPQLVDGVSSKKNEYLAILSPDNEQCLYTRAVDVVNKNSAFVSDKEKEVFMYSKRANSDAAFDNGTLFTDPFNEGTDAYGGACLSPDNKKMYITICRPGKGGYNNCDIYSAELLDGAWDNIKNLGPNVNTDDGWESQPTLSSDGNTLIFATARADSKSIDLYQSKKQADGTWSRATSLSKNINTDGKEKTPFLHSDSQTLYFSSDGHRGVGGFDVFYTRMDDKGNWTKPQNIGFPINSEADEYGFFVSLDGHKGYYASSKLANIGRGGIDVFNFAMPEDAKPEKVLFMKGVLKDEMGNASSTGSIELKNTKTKEVKKIEVDRKTGEYAAIVTLKKNEDIVLTVKQYNAVPTATLYTIKDTVLGSKPVKKDIVNEEIKVGKTYALNNISYKTNSSQLTDESFLIIDDLIDFLKENQSINIAIQGHTDNQGSADGNLALSTDRAFSVKDYIESKGINKERLQFKGFGATKPVTSNGTEQGRQRNRRTEFVITSKS
jgi:outer membrane protein OmpA-like peptidoglycan-associated protein